ncbi:MAG: DNA methyltransferase [Tepidisphaeraceae bacterium]
MEKPLLFTMEDARLTVGEPKDLSDVFNVASVREELTRTDWAFRDDDTRYLTHDIHPYPAKFIPQIPSHLIAALSLRGELVFDPFGGSGTTALEAVRLGRRVVCTDANPVGLLVGRVKTARVTPEATTELHAIKNGVLSARADLPPTDRLLSQYASHIPPIPNREKWFPDVSCGELALIRERIGRLSTSQARNIALLAMSRIVLRASLQDSETRYTAKPRDIARGDVLAAFARAIDDVIADVAETAAVVRYGVADFVQADTRSLPKDRFPDECIDLIVTSPPYGNATDYHLYHRFRLFWLGFDPRDLAAIEIGSHLRHQREGSGFESYQGEMSRCMAEFARVLKAGRYAAVVIGDSIYEGTNYDGADMIARLGRGCGFEVVCTLHRPIHQTKRSFVAAARRATSEGIVVLRKPPHAKCVSLLAPPYRLWPYEEKLRQREATLVAKPLVRERSSELLVKADADTLPRLRELAFTHVITTPSGASERTWQAIVENGFATPTSARKDPKYVTHGLHPYKGKFYPQLAKALLRLAGTRPGARVFDPFCGSGTTLLEAYLNGMESHGCDLHPLAAKIARAKLGVLELDPDLFQDATQTLMQMVEKAPKVLPGELGQFAEGAHEEIASWFAPPVVRKVNWLLGTIRTVSSGILRDYFEVILSSLIRQISHQDPTDLRIRRRKEPLQDADALGMFVAALRSQTERVEQFWSIRGYAPCRFRAGTVVEGDARLWTTMSTAGVSDGSVDVVLTSPPYATALPYIDTDRLSLLTLFGLNAADRKPLEFGLTGSREIERRERAGIDAQLEDGAKFDLPDSVVRFARSVKLKMGEREVGFRRQNTPALLLRFFRDMAAIMSNVARALRPGGDAFIVMGDNYTSNGAETIDVPTTRVVREISEHCGLQHVESIPITVTTQNLKHIRNAIRENAVIWMRR